MKTGKNSKINKRASRASTHRSRAAARLRKAAHSHPGVKEVMDVYGGVWPVQQVSLIPMQVSEPPHSTYTSDNSVG